MVARMRELNIRLFACKAMVEAESDVTTQSDAHPLLAREMLTRQVEVGADELLAQLLVQVAAVAGRQILEQRRRLPTSDVSTDFLCQQMAHFLLTVVYMLQSGSFRKTLAALKQVMTSQQVSSVNAHLFVASEVSDVMQALSRNEPTLTLQWCNVLVLLGVDDVTFWHGVMMSERRLLTSSHSSDTQHDKR